MKLYRVNYYYIDCNGKPAELYFRSKQPGHKLSWSAIEAALGIHFEPENGETLELAFIGEPSTFPEVK